MNPPNTIATDTLVEAIARGIAKAKGIEICASASYRHSTFGPLAQAALTAITEAGYAVVPFKATFKAGHPETIIMYHEGACTVFTESGAMIHATNNGKAE